MVLSIRSVSVALISEKKSSPNAAFLVSFFSILVRFSSFKKILFYFIFCRSGYAFDMNSLVYFFVDRPKSHIYRNDIVTNTQYYVTRNTQCACCERSIERQQKSVAGKAFPSKPKIKLIL